MDSLDLDTYSFPKLPSSTILKDEIDHTPVTQGNSSKKEPWEAKHLQCLLQKAKLEQPGQAAFYCGQCFWSGNLKAKAIGKVSLEWYETEVFISFLCITWKTKISDVLALLFIPETISLPTVFDPINLIPQPCQLLVMYIFLYVQ